MEIGQITYSIKVSKIISVRFIDKNVVKNVINGVNFVKINHFSENSRNGQFGAKITLSVKIRENWSNNFFTKSF